MYILIPEKGELSLQQRDDMKSFLIMDQSRDGVAHALEAIAEPAEDNHFWIDADSVIELSGCSSDPAWVEGFWAMLKAVEPYGYADLAGRRVKAHVQRD
jgi:hypothetical protein